MKLIGNYMQAIEWCHFRWPWVTPDSGFKVVVVLKGECLQSDTFYRQLLYRTLIGNHRQASDRQASYKYSLQPHCSYINRAIVSQASRGFVSDSWAFLLRYRTSKSSDMISISTVLPVYDSELQTEGVQTMKAFADNAIGIHGTESNNICRTIVMCVLVNSRGWGEIGKPEWKQIMSCIPLGLYSTVTAATSGERVCSLLVAKTIPTLHLLTLWPWHLTFWPQIKY